MTRHYFYDGSELAGTRVLLHSLETAGDAEVVTQSAEMGTISVNGVQFDDPGGTLTITGWRPFYITEDQSVEARLFTGYIGEVRVSRGTYDITSTGRVFDCDLYDENAVFGLRKITGSDGKRPSETETARLTWLLASTYLTGLIYNDGLVSAGTDTLDEADFRGRTPADVLNEMAGILGRNYFARYGSTNNRIQLFYNSQTATTNTSTISVVNDGTNDQSTSFAPLVDAILTKDNSATYSGVYLQTPVGNTYATRTSTATAFIARDMSFSTDRVSTLAEAEAFAQRMLDDHDATQDRLSYSVILNDTQVNLILAGQRMQVKFTHLAGYTSLTYVRVTRRTVRPILPRRYRVDLEASNDNPLAVLGPLANLPLQCPGPVISQDAAIIPVGAATPERWNLPFTPTSGNLLVCGLVYRGTEQDIVAPTGWTLAQEVSTATLARGGVIYKTSDGTEANTYVDMIASGLSGSNLWNGWIYEIRDAGAVTSTEGTASAADCAASVILSAASITASALSLVLGFFAIESGPPPGGCNPWDFTQVSPWLLDGEIINPNTGTTGPSLAAVHRNVTTAGSYTPNVTSSQTQKYAAFAIAIAADPNACKPATGQPVNNESPTEATNGVRSLFTAPYPYATGSMRVQVQGIDVTDFAVTEIDPAAGTFSLDFAPLAVETVTLYFLGR